MTRKIFMVEKKENRDKEIEKKKKMKDSLSSPISMLRDDTNHLQQQTTTPPDYRLISNPFDPPSSIHLKQRLASFSIFNEVSVHFQ
jgi:hypothetical protein